jgi:hypothetical protein
MMGTLYPAGIDLVLEGRERAHLRAECLLKAEDDAQLLIQLRFLQLTSAESYESVERQIAVETTIRELMLGGMQRPFSVRDLFNLKGQCEIEAKRLESGTIRLTISVRNTTPSREVSADPVLYAFHSAHVAAVAGSGRFLSLTDPPAYLVKDAAQCENVGVWPILVGDPGHAATMLASPIVLPDYPAIAPESPGDLYDSSEIDEILTLRILTMTDEEKADARATGERARGIIERTESLTRANLSQLHGAFRAPDDRAPWSSWDTGMRATASSVCLHDTQLTIGDRVRLRPKNRADILDSALEGRAATIAGIEQDLEDRLHVAVVLDDDPGRDLGELRQPGHRFFFSPEEVEPLEQTALEPRT